MKNRYGSKGKTGYTLEQDNKVVETFGNWSDCWDYWFWEMDAPEDYCIRDDKTQAKTMLWYTAEEKNRYLKRYGGRRV